MGLPWLLTSGDRSLSNRSRSSTDSETLPEYIHDQTQLLCTPPQRPDLRELNNSLEALAAVFPDIQIEVFRELLSKFDGESRLALVADALLKNRVTWVKGRWRVVNGTIQVAGLIPAGEAFRSSEYIHAVKSLAWHEFKGLSRSTINAVLAESNYSYLDARCILVDLSSKSWRFAISTLFSRRKPIATGEAEKHPLVIWRSSGQGSIYPAIRATGNAELDRELFMKLIHPLKEREREDREIKDREMAIQLNNEEAETAEATHDCACCFVPAAFEEFTHCNSEGHMICFRCVHYSVKEALFGQGWQSTINPETGTLKCMAVEGNNCTGHIPPDHLHRAIIEENKGAELLLKLDQRLTEHSLLAAGLPLVRCPFCNYAEIDDVYEPDGEPRLRVRFGSMINMAVVVLFLGTIPLILHIVLLTSVASLLIMIWLNFRGYLCVEWKAAMGRLGRRRRGHKFKCQNPECSRESCLLCNKSWTDVHVCNESSLVALRTQVEQAMSMAIKRVCPRCNTSFVKNEGCNKLTCPCGYKMCYVCRADLSDEGYRHFCDHFRPNGDPSPCNVCDRCNLWESEDTDRVMQEAREEAERKWKEMESRELSVSEKAFLDTGIASVNGNSAVKWIYAFRKMPTIQEVFDLIVETLFV